MNYLAHLYFAKPSADSHMGNLLGDFRKGADLSSYSKDILLGLQNHCLVDKFTDQHRQIKQVKQLFTQAQRRFSGIAIDVLFDHFLIKHWAKFHEEDFSVFKKQCYQQLIYNLEIMPSRMQSVVSKMAQDDWFEQYRQLTGVESALINIAKRIRFENQFNLSVNDVRQHYGQFEDVFLSFFPELIKQVKLYSPEG